VGYCGGGLQVRSLRLLQRPGPLLVRPIKPQAHKVGPPAPAPPPPDTPPCPWGVTQVLFGSFPIAHCRNPYAVVRYLAERVWPRLQDALRLKPREQQGEGGTEGSAGRGVESAGTQRGATAEQATRERGDGGGGGRVGAGAGGGWSPLALCEALAHRHNWRSRRGGRPDVYRAANWLLRGALAGRPGLVLAFLPPAP
jgi:hypothetical protein